MTTGRRPAQARSVGSAATRLRMKLRPSSTCSSGRVGARHQDARPAGEGDARQVAPRFGERPAGADGRDALVDEDDRGRSPDGDLLPQRADPGGQLRVGRHVAGGRYLEQVGDAVAGCHQGVVRGLDRRPGRDDAGGHEPSEECPPELALMVVAGGHADGRRIEPDEQEPVAQWRQVLEGLDRGPIEDDASCGGCPGRGRRVRSASSSGVMWARLWSAGRSGGSSQPVAPVGWSASAQAGRSSPESVGGSVGAAGACLDLGLRLGGLGLGLADAAPEGGAPFGQRLGSAHDQHADQDDDEDDQDVGSHGAMVQRGQRGRCATGMTRRSAVWVAENEPTLLSTRRASLAASMTWTSRSVAALPFRETTQIAPFGRIRPASALSGASASHVSAPKRTTSVSGSGQPSVTSVVRAAIAGGCRGRRCRRARRASPGGCRACRAAGWCRRAPCPLSCHAMLLVFGPRSPTYDFGPGHPLTPRRFGPGLDLLRAVGAEPGSGARTGRPTRSWSGATRAAYLAAVKRFSADPFGIPEAGIGAGGDDPPFAGMHEAAAAVAGGSIRAIEAILRGDVEHAFHPGGGLHHAMPDHASGFCIYDDPALAIARARRDGLRVLYVDLDVHHGDGVQAIHAAGPGRADAVVPRDRALPLPGDGRGRGAGRGGRRRDVGQRAARTRDGRGGVAGGGRAGCSPSWPPRSGRTSSCRSTAPTRTRGTRSRTCS